jgi:hypothetical protein
MLGELRGDYLQRNGPFPDNRLVRPVYSELGRLPAIAAREYDDEPIPLKQTWRIINMPKQKYSACIEACNSCAVACNHCAASCLQEQDVKMMARCIALDLDCAQICALAAAAMARGSEHAKAICGLCADICQSCADECAKHAMEHCQQCAKACLQCALECRKMAAAA